ncbi:PilZ domain-containing protein [Psychrosphaera aestuarii]|mgnify:FL=1|uniref:PilZ domain-containing protein n=1 Tax=Psychrosphaera aestuarii TaxID=1266052 RepID=UPI001B33EB73|nr:PilZ domain-containing protein [Psychrosphaera aestuarii]
MNRLVAEIEDTKELFRCYMPFVKGGGLFIKTNLPVKLGETASVILTLPDALEPELFDAEVIWVTPQGAQNVNPPGVGVLLNNTENRLQVKIEKLLGTMINLPEPTYTM